MKRKQASLKAMVIAAISFGFFAGVELASGIDRLVRHRAELYWFGDFAVAFGFGLVAVKYGSMVLKTHRPTDESVSQSG